MPSDPPPPPPPQPSDVGDTEPGADDEMPSEPPRRLHPFGIVRGIGLGSLTSIPAFLIFATQVEWGFVAALAVFAVIGIVLRVLAWLRHTYELRGGRIIERSGILSRSERALEIDRIQQIDVERTLLDRAVGTCELRLETAADSGESELTLTVVTVEEAQRLREVLAAASARLTRDAAEDAQDTDAATSDAGTGSDTAARVDRPERTLVEVPLWHVALAAVTGPRLLAIPAGIAVLFGVIGDTLGSRADPDELTDGAADIAESTVARLGLIGAIVIGLGLLVLSLVLTAVFGVIRDGGFTIVRRDSEIVVRRGLTTTRSATVPLRRVQRVSVGRSWIHRLLGFATLTIHTAGSVSRGGGDGNPQSSLDRSLTVPLLPEDRVDGLLDELLGTSTLPELTRHPVAARRRSILRSLVFGLGVAAGGVTTFLALDQTGAAIAWSLGALAAAAAIGEGRYRRLRTGLGDELVVGQQGLVGTTLTIAPRRKVQGVTVTSSWFQRRRDLATATVHVAGPSGGVTLPDLGQQAAVGVSAGLT